MLKEFIKRYWMGIVVVLATCGAMLYSTIDYSYSAGYGQSGKTSKYSKAINIETLTIPSGATATFTLGKLSTIDGDKTTRAVIQLEGADIRYTYEGTTPSASVGQRITDGSWFQIIGDVNVLNFEAYGLTGTATAYVVYESEREMNKTGFGE